MNSALPPVGPAIENDLIDFAELWRTLSRYKWPVLGVMLTFAVLGVVAAVSADPYYRAELTVLVEARASHAVQVQEVYDPGYGTEEYYLTQSELLRSRDLVGKVVDQLKLADNPEIVPREPGFMQQLMSGRWLPFVPAAELTPDSPEVRRERAIDAVLKAATVQPVYRTQMLKAYVESRSPQLAAQIANTLGDQFVNEGIAARLEATERATRWLTLRLADIKVKLEESEHALQQYREAHQLVNVGGARGMYEEDVVDNARKLREAQQKKTQLASTYSKIEQAGPDDKALQDISALLLDPPVQRAGENLLAAEQSVKQLEDRYGAKHPQMTTAQARLLAAQRSYYSQLRLAANGIKAEYEIAAETERALTSVVQSGKDRIRKLDQNDYELRGLEREVNTNRDLYDLFLKRFKETDTTASFESLDARIVDRAVPPRSPWRPHKKKVVLLWTLGGLLLGVILAALRHLTAQVIQSPEQLEQVTQLPVLAVLPPVSGLGLKTSAPALCLDQPRAAFPEGVRSIRAALHLNDVDKRIKKVMLTSALPREGKSSIASSFAAVLGHSEQVVLVEGDLRAPTLKKIFNIPADAPGLVELLTGEATLEQALFVHPSGIHVLPVAKVPTHPAEVVASMAMAKLIELLAGKYDRVILDSPPCQVASDSVLLARHMDAVLFVVHGGTTSLRTINAAIRHLRNAQAPLLGHVLNQVDARKAYGYHGSYYVYGQYGQ